MKISGEYKNYSMVIELISVDNYKLTEYQKRIICKYNGKYVTITDNIMFFPSYMKQIINKSNLEYIYIQNLTGNKKLWAFREKIDI